MKEARSFRDLRVWQAATDLAVSAYTLTEEWPSDERYGLCSQVRRASVSVAANIAEGWGRHGHAEFIRFLLIANGSLKELETLNEIAFRVGLFSDASRDTIETACAEVSRMLHALIASIHKQKDSLIHEETMEYDRVWEMQEVMEIGSNQLQAP